MFLNRRDLKMLESLSWLLAVTNRNLRDDVEYLFRSGLVRASCWPRLASIDRAAATSERIAIFCGEATASILSSAAPAHGETP